MSFRMNDLPLLLKVSIAPAFAFLVLLILASYAYVGLGSASSGVTNIVGTDMQLSRQLQEANNQFKEIDGSLYRVITFYAADNEAVDLFEEVDTLKAQIDTLSEKLAGIKTGFEGQIDVAELESVEAEVQKYSEAIDVVFAMLEIDFASAVSFLQPFKENAASVSATFNSLSQKALDNSDKRGATIQDDVASMKTSFLVGTLIAGLLVASLSWLIGGLTSRSIREIAGATEKLAGGDRDVNIASLERKDELGIVVSALGEFSRQMLENDRLQEEREELRHKAEEEERSRAEEERLALERKQQEDEDRRIEAENERKAMMMQLADAFDMSVSSVVSVVQESAGQLGQSASGLQDRAVGNSELCRDLSSVATEVSTGMQTVATATEELSSSVGEISRQMGSASKEITEVAGQTRETNETVTELASAVERIGEIVNLINEIAAQTNLLALNATIEAARAGDAGKGFAVVASEVKGLASQTAKATDEITTQIDNVQSSTETVVQAMEIIETRIEQVNGIAASVASAVEEQTGATGEIAQTVSHANDKISTLTRNSEELNGSAVDNGEAAKELLDTVEMLEKQFDQLENETSGFVDKIRST